MEKNMKKIYFSLMLLATLFVTSCSMDQKPFGALDDQSAIRNEKDLYQFRNILYSNLRGLTSGGWLYQPDLVADEFVGLLSNGNRNGDLNSGNILASTGEIESMWGGCYSIIKNCNKLMEEADKLLGQEGLTDAQVLAIKRYRAEASFTRAYAYFFLADHFCQSYTQTNPEAEHSGLPLQTVYYPTASASYYPDRSTLVETFRLIETDLANAYDGIKAYEASGASDVADLLKPNAAYVSSFAVEAMMARVALVKGDYPTALAKAKDVITNGAYTLTTIADYKKLWTNDTGTEVIFRPFMSNTELGGSVGGAYISYDNQTCDYIPTYATLNTFAVEGDVRFDTFFEVNEGVKVEGSTYGLYQFVKFPGNTTLRTGSTNNLVNMCKPFRLSEMYLIAAEAAARTNVDGSSYLNDFLKNRIEDYQTASFTSEQLLNSALRQRQLEFVGEGFRLSDLRRLGLGFSRTADYPAAMGINGIITVKSASVTYKAGDYRYTWPIPQSELDSNPKLKTQQNPGYAD